MAHARASSSWDNAGCRPLKKAAVAGLSAPLGTADPHVSGAILGPDGTLAGLGLELGTSKGEFEALAALEAPTSLLAVVTRRGAGSG